MRGLHGEGAGDPERFAGAEGQEQPPGLEVGSQNGVDDAQPRDGRPAQVDAGQVLGGNLRLVAGSEAEATEPEHGPMANQGEQGPRGVEGMLSPSGPRIVRRSVSPSSTWPLMSSWVEACRFSSRVSAAVAPTAACR